ncbi:hypothetical protein PMIN01_05663 [Paraphaeosphaeria minitans]|uniref:Uncharacterized protein n=1 Tax=Paraphaeosphaeria minitans TaxID=565426 RepID=A0A9P6GIJ3_9PLEO|nr:hypothetical protein PMIN01_05663 [Paraphaeosphaeria minitans]
MSLRELYVNRPAVSPSRRPVMRSGGMQLQHARSQRVSVHFPRPRRTSRLRTARRASFRSMRLENTSSRIIYAALAACAEWRKVWVRVCGRILSRST